ncbi:hypothetical protein LJC59_08565 [Desulfovibrio sp. OttesenSCG-928-A18]|nr:hypothetical protein [Desulfovibrio sp. OttesenSCG-928-A18]
MTFIAVQLSYFLFCSLPFKKRLALYGIRNRKNCFIFKKRGFSLAFCQSGIYYGIIIADTLLHSFDDPSWVGFLPIVLGTIASIFVFISYYRLYMYKADGLRWTRIVLLALPLLPIVLHYLSTWLCALWTGQRPVPVPDPAPAPDPFWAAFACSMFTIPFFLYFTFSPGVRQRWADIRAGVYAKRGL